MRAISVRHTALAFVLAAALPCAGAAAATHPQVAADGADLLDSRWGAPVTGPTPTQRAAIVDLVSNMPQVRLRWNATFGTPASIVRHGTALTGPQTGPPADAGRAWLSRHAALFGWTSADVSGLHARTLVQPGQHGPRIVLFHQVYDGLRAGSLGGSLAITLDRENRILLVRANATRDTALSATSRLSASQAFGVASGVRAPDLSGVTAGWTTFARGTFAGPHYARQVAFPKIGSVHPAWEVIWVKRLDEVYRVVVDASTGEVVFRAQIARYAEPTGSIFRNYPGAPVGGEQEEVSFAGDPAASPGGWVTIRGAELPTTAGNNAQSSTNWGVFTVPEGGQLRPFAPDGRFNYDFVDAWSGTICGRNPLSVSTGFPDTPAYALDALPATTNLFYHHNLMHDFWYRLGFTEAAGALQLENYGKGGEGGDPLLGLVQAGALGGDGPTELGRNNAYMLTLPDGLPAWSGMFLWEPSPDFFLSRCVDGDFAADIIYHEYTHAVTNRWVGGGFGNLDSFQGGSMGEGWSDFAAMHYLISRGLETNDVIGQYVTGDRQRSFRNWPLSKVDAGFGDIGYDTSGDEVHADGEIWSGALWKLRQALAGSAGSTYAMQIVADAMPSSGPMPSMLDMRDAILSADTARTGGAHQATLWNVFARRGMGDSAQTEDANDTDPRPAFDHLDRRRNGLIAGKLIDAATKEPVPGAKVLVGHFEARASAAQRTGTDGSFSFPIMEGTWPLTIQARGYGARTLWVDVRAGKTTRLDFKLPVNFASAAAGATVAASSNASVLGPPELALSDSESNAWWTDSDGDPTGEFFVVDLAGDQPVRLTEMRISAFNTAFRPFEALRDFTILASIDGQSYSEFLTGSFPTSPPRPLTPDVRYKRFPLSSPVRASFLKFVANNPQSATAGGVQVAEVQAFGAGEDVVPQDPGGGDPPVHDEGIALAPTADATLTANAMTAACVFPPATQGLDAWVTELPDSYADGTHVITVRPESEVPQARADVDVYFLSGDCQVTGGLATPSAGESGTIPQASKYVVSQLFSSYASRIIVDARSAP